MTKNHPILTSFLLAAGLLAGCTDHNTPEPAEITVHTGVTPMTQRIPTRRARTYDNTAALRTEGSFSCVAYNANTTTAYIPATTLDWNGVENAWKFNGGASHYYWPLPSTNGGAYPSLDFFAYIPTSVNLSTEAPYIQSLTYTAAHNVTFACTNLPMTDTEQEDLKEFMFGMTLDQNKTNASSGVYMTFQHPFARVKLVLEASHPAITINSVTFKDIKNNGSYDLSASPKWTLSGDATNLVFGDTTAFTLNVAAQQIGNDLIVIPQEWAGEIEVNASWNDWGDTPVAHALSTTVSPITWQAGYSYTYTFNISPEDLTVNVNNFTEQW